MDKFVDLIVLELGQVACPASVSAAAARSISKKDFFASPLFEDYLKRQCERQIQHYSDGGELRDFRAEDWP